MFKFILDVMFNKCEYLFNMLYTNVFRFSALRL